MRDEDLTRALEVMQERVLPQWASRCTGDCIETWSQTAGEVLGITAGQQN